MVANEAKILTISGGYCSITALYDRIAMALGLPHGDNVHYNCTKIEVSVHLQDEVFAYYKEVQKAEADSIAMWWVCFGPKATENLEENEVRVQDGWYSVD